MAINWKVRAWGQHYEIDFDFAAQPVHHVLLSADRHHDNPHSLNNLEKKHLDKAADLGAAIIDIGDLFCAMQGRYDPRRNLDDVKEEHKGADYIDRLISTAHSFYEPYGANFAVLTPGNHESAILKNNGVDLTRNLAQRLRGYRKAQNPFVGNYQGFVKLASTGSIRGCKPLLVFYHHGAGGGGPVTKGVIQTNRRAVFLPDADIILTGHIHEAWQVPIKRMRIDRRGRQYYDLQQHIQLPTYKDEFDANGGFHIERGRPPKPVGCWWLELKVDGGRIKATARADVE